MEEQKTDLLGVPIEQGSLVAIGRSGQGSRQMEIRIVSSVSLNSKGTGRVYFYGKKYNWRKPPAYFSEKATWSDLSKGNIQEHMVVIREPMYSLNNPSIAKQLAVADDAKDAGFLPENYVLGTPKSEWKEES